MIETIAVIALLIISTELVTGTAFLAGSGGGGLIERAIDPGQHWLTIALHALGGLALPVLYFVVA